MTTKPTAQTTIQRLRIQNYRVLRDVQFDKLTLLTVLLGPNGSGKSTVFDVFAFLHEAFTTNLRAAWDHRNRIRELRSRGESGPITIEIAYRQALRERLVTYRLELDEENGLPVVVRELLRWSTSPGSGRPRDILSFQRGEGWLYDDFGEVYTEERLDSPDLLAVSTLGGLARRPRVANLRRFISGWYLSYLSGGAKRTVPEAGPQARLSETGDNLPNVIQYLSEQHPDRLVKILRVLADRVPQLKRVETELLADGRLLLRFKDAPFTEPVLAKYRDPDAIAGGTCEALEHVLQARGYHLGDLSNIAAATEIACHMNVDDNRSRSFQVFRDGVRRLVAGGSSAAQD